MKHTINPSLRRFFAQTGIGLLAYTGMPSWLQAMEGMGQMPKMAPNKASSVITKPVTIPRSSLFRWEIGIALFIKVLFLIGLWFLIFRWPDKPTAKPDIAAHFLQPPTPPQAVPDFSSQSSKESHHVR